MFYSYLFLFSVCILDLETVSYSYVFRCLETGKCFKKAEINQQSKILIEFARNISFILMNENSCIELSNDFYNYFTS